MEAFFISFTITFLSGASVNKIVAQSVPNRIVNEQIRTIETRDILQLSGLLVKPYNRNS